jgi:type IV pilus assembly protein PilA
VVDAGPGGPRRGLAITSLVLGILSIPTIGLVGVGAMLGIVLGVVALVKARNAPAEYGGKGLAVTGIALSALSVLVMPFVLGIIAAIVIPSVLRARVTANESAAIADVCTVAAAETAYASANGGYYDTLECLAKPTACLPGHSGTAMLDGQLATATVKGGYRRVFQGVPATSGARPAAGSQSSLAHYAYVAIPVAPGQTGVRSFCVDDSGRICYLADGSEPPVVDGACPTRCTDLR